MTNQASSSSPKEKAATSTDNEEPVIPMIPMIEEDPAIPMNAEDPVVSMIEEEPAISRNAEEPVIPANEEPPNEEPASEEPANEEGSVISTGAERSGETRFSTSDPPQPQSPELPIGPSFFMRWLSYLVLVPLIALATAGFGCISLLAGLWDKSGSQQHTIASTWARTLLLISFSPVRIIGAENLPPTAAVYASNHLSYMDTPVLFAKLPFQFRILAKQALWKIPFIGWYLHRSGQVPVDTKSPRSLIASLNRGVATLKHGLPLVLFPEGGRAADGELQSMMSGCAYMALKAQVPLIPLTLIGTYELLPLHTYALNPRPLLIVVGDPIPTTGLTTRDADTLTQRLYQSIQTTYMEMQGIGNRE